jgi:hypothetical protein
MGTPIVRLKNVAAPYYFGHLHFHSRQIQLQSCKLCVTPKNILEHMHPGITILTASEKQLYARTRTDAQKNNHAHMHAHQQKIIWAPAGTSLS